MSRLRILLILGFLVTVQLCRLALAEPEAKGAFASVREGLDDWKIATYLDVLHAVRCDGLSFQGALNIRGLTENDWRRIDREVFLAMAAYEERRSLANLDRLDAVVASMELDLRRMDPEDRRSEEQDLEFLRGLREAYRDSARSRPPLQASDFRGADLIEAWIRQFQQAPCDPDRPSAPGRSGEPSRGAAVQPGFG